MSGFLPVAGHIRRYRLWLFVSLGSQLSPDEHAHLSDCDECTTAFKVYKAYIQADSFAAVLNGSTDKDQNPNY